jgi:asparagine synthase (glutamine-hydrolysing)
MMHPGNVTTPFSGCGFVGAFVNGKDSGNDLLNKIDFEGMVRSIEHRGPESGGFWPHSKHQWIKKGIRLGHRRLSILDLSEMGNQPMTRDHLTIVSNGEVYNFAEVREVLEHEGFTFTSHTDTEVILRAYQKWGIQALDKFNGMFAFAIWNDRKNELLLARDRIGIKPLYYYMDGKILLFGSEVEALIQSKYIPAEIDWQAIYGQVLVNTFYQTDQEKTPVKNVKAMLPGHYMIVRPKNELKIRKYWDLPEYKPSKSKYKLSVRKLTTKLKNLLEDSVKLRLISDVPVAAFLSGGMDSTVINVMASQLVKDYKLTAITVYYEGGGKDVFTNSEDQDLQYSRWVAEKLEGKIDHKIISVKPVGISIELIDRITDLACLSDDNRLLTIYGNYRTVKENDFKVVLNGQGADEIMGGYVYTDFFKKIFFDYFKPNPIVGIKNSFPFMAIPNPKTLKDDILALSESVYENLHNRFFDSPGELMDKGHRFLMKTELQRILKFEDFLSMRSSVECRLPFLDHRIIEWAFESEYVRHIDLPIRTVDLMNLFSRIWRPKTKRSAEEWSNLRKMILWLGDKNVLGLQKLFHRGAINLSAIGKPLLRRVVVNVSPKFKKEVIIRPKQAFPSADQEHTRLALNKIYKNQYEEIINSETIGRVFKKEALKPGKADLSSRELWLIIALWRWEKKLNTIL